MEVEQPNPTDQQDQGVNQLPAEEQPNQVPNQPLDAPTDGPMQPLDTPQKNLPNLVNLISQTSPIFYQIQWLTHSN